MSPSYLIRNARLVDGTGLPWFRAEVLIRDGRVAAVEAPGRLAATAADCVVDAAGRFLTPGFVDAHVHTDLALLAEPDFPAAVFQGVTSHVIGQDGVSYAPASAENQRGLRHYFAGVNGDPDLAVRWSSVAEYLAAFDRRTAQNVAYLLPLGAIRLEVMGHATGDASPAEIARMQALVKAGMKEGAVGVSTGLDYLPGYYAGTEELCQVCIPAGALGGVYVSHIRSYSERLDEAMAEVAQISRIAGMPVHISHYNGKAPRLAGLIDAMRGEGIDVTFETYPFLAGCSILSMIALPRHAEAGGTAATLERLGDPAFVAGLAEWFAAPTYPLESLQLTYVEHGPDRELEGLFLPEAAARRGEQLPEFICGLLLRSELRVGCIAHHATRTMEDVIALMQHPAHMGGSDGIYTGSRPHPRGFATFARYLELVRDEAVMPLETMVQHLAAHPARRFHLRDRGVIRPGAVADLALFDLAQIRAHAAYGEAPRLAEGMGWVFVNGEAVLAEGEPTGAQPGVAVRGPGAV